MNNKGFAVSGVIYSILILFLILIFGVLGILGSRKLILDKLKNDIMNDLNNEVFELAYRDRSGANRPELLNNMIPVKYDGNNWIYADIYEEWYNYEAQEWANAVILNSGVNKSVGDTISEDEIALWYVWIPRYKYQLFNVNNGIATEQLINIDFENGTETTGTVSCQDAINQTDSDGNLISEICTNASNGAWYTHPAFTFGDDELTGFWVGKFEVSGSIDQITIKPGVSNIRNIVVSNFFTAIQNIKTNYNISNGDSHMIKNMEWGAVAYLKQSKYGLGMTDITKNASYYSGGGNTATSYKTYVTLSTTGNVHGVYDMSGGAWEYVMGNMVDSNGSFYISESGFSSAPDDKYYDKYTYDSSSTSHSRGKLGDATKETLRQINTGYGGWYGDYSAFVFQTRSLIARGAYSGNSVEVSGIFATSVDTGINSVYISTRAVLTP